MDAVTAGNKQISRQMFYETKKSKWPSGIEDFTLNLGYQEESVSTITLTFPAKGTYSFDKIYLWNQPLENYGQQMNVLRENCLVNEQIEANRVSGNISLESSRILCLTVPYDGGWTAYVDGKKQPLLKANYMFSALLLPAGEHYIELRYRTPGLDMGLLLTLAGVLSLSGIALHFRRKELSARRQGSGTSQKYGCSKKI